MRAPRAGQQERVLQLGFFDQSRRPSRCRIFEERYRDHVGYFLEKSIAISRASRWQDFYDRLRAWRRRGSWDAQALDLLRLQLCQDKKEVRVFRRGHAGDLQIDVRRWLVSTALPLRYVALCGSQTLCKLRLIEACSLTSSLYR